MVKKKVGMKKIDSVPELVTALQELRSYAEHVLVIITDALADLGVEGVIGGDEFVTELGYTFKV